MTKVSAIRFDPGRRASRADLKASIATFTGHLETEELRLKIRIRARRDQDRKNFRLAVEAVACNLLVTTMVVPDAVLAIPRNHSVIWGEARYRSPVYGQHFLDILDLLTKLKLVAEIAKGWRFSARHKQSTTIRPTSELSRHFTAGVYDWNAFQRVEERELIILKPPKDDSGDAPPIGYKDSARTNRWRQEVEAVNAWLAAAPITIVGVGPSRLTLDHDGQPVEPYRRTLRRVFNNGDWNSGGRLFGGFWMTMERNDRFHTIRVAGEQIANVDFSSLFPRLAYVRARAEQPDGDVYDVRGDGSCRDGWKTLMNAMLFATKPLRAWPTDIRKNLPPGLNLKDAVAAIKDKHGPIGLHPVWLTPA